MEVPLRLNDRQKDQISANCLIRSLLIPTLQKKNKQSKTEEEHACSDWPPLKVKADTIYSESKTFRAPKEENEHLQTGQVCTANHLSEEISENEKLLIQIVEKLEKENKELKAQFETEKSRSNQPFEPAFSPGERAYCSEKSTAKGK